MTPIQKQVADAVKAAIAINPVRLASGRERNLQNQQQASESTLTSIAHREMTEHEVSHFGTTLHQPPVAGQ